MISTASHRKVRIHITTFRRNVYHIENKMNEDKCNRGNFNHNKFICSICLNSKQVRSIACERKLSKSCPICQKTCGICTENNKIKDKEDQTKFKQKLKPGIEARNTKTVQTSETDVTQGLSLLNEVLTVFRKQKQIEITKEKGSKLVVFKDVATTMEKDLVNPQPKLTVSKVYQFSIKENVINNNCKFAILNSFQPNYIKTSYSVDLLKHKSSSIPQMKMDELKNSLKEKSKSKDAIEEVNRMFATVRRNDSQETLDDHNRPVTRNGPRILPVVKTKTHQDFSTCNEHSQKAYSCKCCQMNNYCMSSGDSFIKPECCHHKIPNETERCDKCVYMLCCHYKNNSPEMQTGVAICEHCHNFKEQRCKCGKQDLESSHCEISSG